MLERGKAAAPRQMSTPRDVACQAESSWCAAPSDGLDQPTSLQKQGTAVGKPGRAGPGEGVPDCSGAARESLPSGPEDRAVYPFGKGRGEAGRDEGAAGGPGGGGGPWPDLATTRSPTPFGAVPWARRGFTAEFGMGSGGARALWSPGRARGPAAPEGPQRSEIKDQLRRHRRNHAHVWAWARVGRLRAARGSGLTPPPRHGWRDGRVPWSWSREALGHGRQRSDVGGQMSEGSVPGHGAGAFVSSDICSLTAARGGCRVLGAGYGRDVRAIRTARLHGLPRFDLRPIDVVVDHGSQTRPGLEEGFPLRCSQRLSRPNVATRRCGWRHNRSTRGSSTPVLSY